MFLMENCLVLEVPATTSPKARLDTETSICGLLGVVVPDTVTVNGVTEPDVLVPLTVMVAL
ncbi:MAG: hypothetical protein A2Y77_18180 [Planctomycetes bacterium RBG_13_62_9]|nr:MAG: hypothetical protein A2Y77_18180 [Planctomycetes bacterium RBG_13_62_9]